MTESFKGIYKPIQGHGTYLKASGGFNREYLETSHVDTLQRLGLLHQHGLVALKPQGSKEKTRRYFARALTLTKRNLPWLKILQHARLRRETKTKIVKTNETGNRGKERLNSPRGSGEAKRPPSHISLVGMRENPMQYFGRNTKNRHPVKQGYTAVHFQAEQVWTLVFQLRCRDLWCWRFVNEHQAMGW